MQQQFYNNHHQQQINHINNAQYHEQIAYPVKNQDVHHQSTEDISTQNSPLSYENEESLPINENNVEKFLNLGANQEYIYFNNNPNNYYYQNLPSNISQNPNYQYFAQNSASSTILHQTKNQIHNHQNLNNHEFQIYSSKFKGVDLYDNLLNSASGFQKDDMFMNENDFLTPQSPKIQTQQLDESKNSKNQQLMQIEMQVDEQLKKLNSNDSEEIKNQLKILLDCSKEQITKAQISKLIEKSKRIVKREKAKNRQKVMAELSKNSSIQNQFKGQQQHKLSEITPCLTSVTTTIQTQKKSLDLQQQQLISQIPQFDLEQQQLIDQSDDLLHNNSFSSNDLQYKMDNNQQLLENSSVKFEDNQSTSDSTQNQKNGSISNQNELPQKVQKKIQQMIRNRISAQNSRDRKKAYIQKLESDNDQLCKQNQYLSSQVQQLQAQNKKLQIELQKQKRIIMEQIPQQQQQQQYQSFMNNTQSINYNEVERPLRSGNSAFNTNYYKFGLALLSIVSIICLIHLNQDSSFMDSHPTNNRMLAANSQQSQAMELETTTPKLLQIEDNSQAKQAINIPPSYYSDYQFNSDKKSLNEDLHILLKHIDTYRNNLIKQIQTLSVIKEEEDLSKSLATIPQSKELQQINLIEQNNQLAMINSQDLSTMYCPNLYLHPSSNQNSLGVPQQKALKNSDWIQLLIPKNQIQTLSYLDENNKVNDLSNIIKAAPKSLRSYFKNSNQNSTKQIDIIQGGILNQEEQQNNNNNSLMMVELLCKVHQYREFK